MSLLLEGEPYDLHFREEETRVHTGKEVATQPIPELILLKLHETQQRRYEGGNCEVK